MPHSLSHNFSPKPMSTADFENSRVGCTEEEMEDELGQLWSLFEPTEEPASPEGFPPALKGCGSSTGEPVCRENANGPLMLCSRQLGYRESRGIDKQRPLPTNLTDQSFACICALLQPQCWVPRRQRSCPGRQREPQQLRPQRQQQQQRQQRAQAPRRRQSAAALWQRSQFGHRFHLPPT